MSVRVVYMRRARRGGLVAGLRLVGATGEATWTPRVSSEQDAGVFTDAAKWIKQTLEGPRSRDALEAIVLDASGATCAWVTSASTDLSAVASAARGAGVNDEESGSGGSAMEFFAPSDMESSVQPLGVEIKPESKHTLLKARKPKDLPAPQRLAVLATGDVPGRVLVDELDRVGVRTGQVCTIWHAMASAWGSTANSPGTPVSSSRESVATSSGDAVVGVVLIDPEGQLLWCWAHEGELLASGSMRVRVVRPVAVGGDDTPDAIIACDAADVGRLVNEWLGWSMQLSRGPTRVVCVLPESMGDGGDVATGDEATMMRAGEFGEAFANKWAMASVDAVVHDDPVGATLKRMVNVLEATPASVSLKPGQALVALSNRPNVQTRRLYVWGAAALFGAAGVVGALGWMFQRQAAAADAQAAAYRAAWQQPAKDVYPPAFDSGFQRGVSPLQKLSDEVKRREDAMSKPSIASEIKPVLTELEKISLVLSAPNVKVENIQLDSGSVPRVMATVPTTRDAELLLEGLRRVSGGVLTNWTMTMQDVGGTGERRVTFESKWPDDKRTER
ncbi:MAG TPA: hypothetical protein VK157_17620 [Phycisphaerales bacterium]|nr:hypothetical protein [Phycisphaerales bacterium]